MASPARGIRGLDFGTQGCFEHVLPTIVTVGLCVPCAAGDTNKVHPVTFHVSRFTFLLAGTSVFHLGPDVQTHAGDPAVRAAAAGLLAAAPHRIRICSHPPHHPTRLVGEKIPFFLLAAVASALTIFVQLQGRALESLSSRPVSARIANALVAYAGYLGKTFWPVDLPIPIRWSGIGRGVWCSRLVHW